MTEAEQIEQAVPSIDQPNRVKRTLTKDLDFPLTDAEMSLRATDLAELDQQRQLIEVEFDGVKKDFRAKLAEKKKKIQELMSTIRAGHETRTVEAEVIFDYATGEVEYHVDGKIHTRRTMTADELQQDMFIKGANPIEGRQQADELQAGSGEDNPDVEAAEAHKEAEIAELRAEETGKTTKRSPVH